MTDRPTLDQILSAINSAQSALITLTEYARDLAVQPDATLTEFEDVPQNLADALAATLDALPATDEDHNQLRGALARYLEGWAP